MAEAMLLIWGKARTRRLVAHIHVNVVLMRCAKNFVLWRDYVKYRLACFSILVRLLMWRVRFKRRWGRDHGER
jgi:hypothetical protein